LAAVRIPAPEAPRRLLASPGPSIGAPARRSAPSRRTSQSSEGRRGSASTPVVGVAAEGVLKADEGGRDAPVSNRDS
jgi:hypothetical protein